MKHNITLLLVNPWITDFAAYNLWSEPLGLLYVGSLLKEAGAQVSLVDCLHSSRRPDPAAKPDGRSKFHRTVIDTPRGLEFMDREYARYGMSEEEFVSHLEACTRPDAVLVTSMMTYWYPGVAGTIALLREVLGGNVPIILGGVYATLCPGHARALSGADAVHSGVFGPVIVEMIEGLTHRSFPRRSQPQSFADYPRPLHGLRAERSFIAVLTGTGCPFSCSYCASAVLTGDHARRPVESVLRELTAFAGAGNAAFYDDALLYDAESHFLPLAEAIGRTRPGPDLHIPNGVHARFVTADIARRMIDIGVKTIRIGLETASEAAQAETGGKTTGAEYRQAVAHLRGAGYSRADLGTYVMLGLPGQSPGEVDATLDFVHECGGAPILSYYSPIPGTALWGNALRSSSFPLLTEPLFHNNTVYVRGCDSLSSGAVGRLREKARELRSAP